MRIDHPERIARMSVCSDCRDVVGPFWRLYGQLAGQGPLLQRGTCDLHPPRPDAPRWPRFDFNRGVDLCYCCGIEPLATGSRYNEWFCPVCKNLVGQLNGRHGRCIVPTGRHSFHWGWVIKGEDLDDAVTVHQFCEASQAAGVTTRVLTEWSHIAIDLNLEAIGAASGDAPVPIIDYWREVAQRVRGEDRFQEMCVYLDQRGRAELERRQEAGR